jgi:spore maturation protein CgeB
MRVLLVGLRQAGQVGGHCEQALRELEHTIRQLEVLDVAAHPLFRHRDSANALISQAAGALHKAWLNRELLGRARAMRPDVVLVIKGHELRPATLAAVRVETEACLGNWNTDNPFNRLNSSRDLLAAIPVYDCCFIWGRFLVPRLQQAGARRVEYLPFAYNPALHRQLKEPRPNAAGAPATIVFAGSPDPTRLPYLRRVADMDLELWGNHWHRLPAGDELRARWKGVAEGERLAPVLSSCAVALNFVREQNGPAHNMRTYEAPACGAFLLTSRTEEQVELLGNGASAGAAYFETPDELREKVGYFLKRPAEREAIARRGYERITQGGNTYRDRMEKVLRVLKY